MKVYSIKLSRQAESYFLRLDRRAKERIAAALRLLAQDPFAPNPDVKSLAGQTKRYRLRVGDLRIVYSIDRGMLLIFVITIAPRGDVYKK